MRQVTLLQIGQVKDPAVRAALAEIQSASGEVDIVTITKNFSISGTFTPTRTLNVSTATLSNLIAFVATLVGDLQRGGANRTS